MMAPVQTDENYLHGKCLGAIPRVVPRLLPLRPEPELKSESGRMVLVILILMCNQCFYSLTYLKTTTTEQAVLFNNVTNRQLLRWQTNTIISDIEANCYFVALLRNRNGLQSWMVKLNVTHVVIHQVQPGFYSERFKTCTPSLSALSDEHKEVHRMKHDCIADFCKPKKLKSHKPVNQLPIQPS